MAEGRFADAVPIYQELSRSLPGNVGLRLNLALAYHMSGDQKRAVPEFERVLKSDPTSVPALLSLGAAYLGLNEPAKAIPPLQSVVKLQPSAGNARGMLANALLSLERAQEASAEFRKLTTDTPNDPKAWYGLGRSYEALARTAFTQLNKTAQGSAEWLALIADSRLEQRQYRSAFYFYKQALEKSPAFPGIHTALADLYRRTDHPDWAQLETGKELRLSSGDCAKNRQACDYMAGRLRQAALGPSLYWQARAYNELALRAFRQLGTLPASPELHAMKAEVFASRQQHLQAAAEWRAALKLAPSDPHLQRQLAIALYEAADYAAAGPLLEALLKQDPQSPELNFFRGESLLRAEQVEQAIPFLETAVRQDPELLPARASLGLAYTRVGKESQAVEHLQKALEIDEDGSIHVQLGRAYQRAGNPEAAKQMMAKYNEIQQRSKREERQLEQQGEITAPLP